MASKSYNRTVTLPKQEAVLDLFPSSVKHITHDPSLVQLLLITLSNLLIVFPHFGDSIVVGVLHREIRPTFTEAHNLDKTDGNIFPSVDVIVVDSQDPIAVGIHVAISGVGFVLFLSFDGGGTVEDDAVAGIGRG